MKRLKIINLEGREINALSIYFFVSSFLFFAKEQLQCGFWSREFISSFDPSKLDEFLSKMFEASREKRKKHAIYTISIFRNTLRCDFWTIYYLANLSSLSSWILDEFLSKKLEIINLEKKEIDTIYAIYF